MGGRLYNEDITKGQLMEMVSIPLSALQSSLEYFSTEAIAYENVPEMREWCIGRASAYAALIELWHTPTV